MLRNTILITVANLTINNLSQLKHYPRLLISKAFSRHADIQELTEKLHGIFLLIIQIFCRAAAMQPQYSHQPDVRLSVCQTRKL